MPRTNTVASSPPTLTWWNRWTCKPRRLSCCCAVRCALVRCSVCVHMRTRKNMRACVCAHAYTHACRQGCSHLHTCGLCRAQHEFALSRQQHTPVCMSVHMSIHTSVHMSIHTSVHMSIHTPVHMSIHTPVHMSMHTSVHRCIHTSVHMSTHTSANSYTTHECMRPLRTRACGHGVWGMNMCAYMCVV